MISTNTGSSLTKQKILSLRDQENANQSGRYHFSAWQELKRLIMPMLERVWGK
jgi:hypothetical protein